MVSTFLSYDLVRRDLLTATKRVASDTLNARDTAYYKANIGKVGSVDDLLKDYRLYSYAMKAYGLEDMIYAKAFMKKVLESDLNDSDSYANKLTDERYRQFAAAFNFGAQSKAAQSSAQSDELVGLYKASITAEGEQVDADMRYYNAVIDTVPNVDQLLGNERLRNIILKTFNLDTKTYSFDHLKKVLTSDLNDPNSYVNQLPAFQADGTTATNKAVYLSLASFFSFNADGTVNGKAQTDEKKASLMANYVTFVPSYTTPAEAKVNDAYYKSKLASITKPQDITSDSALFAYVKTAFNLKPGLLTTEFYNIVTSDLTDPNNYAKKQGGDAWVELAKAFNFDTSGNVKAGMQAQDTAQLTMTSNGYFSRYDDAEEAARDKLLESYKSNIKTIAKVDDLFLPANATLLNTALKAFQIAPGEMSKTNLRRVLTSDLNDPRSYANTLKDKRYADLARAFNFTKTGDIATPLMAQNAGTIRDIAKDYIIEKMRFVDDKEKNAVRKKADEAAKYYTDNIGKVKTSADFLKDRKLVDVVLTAKGIDPTKVTTDFLKQIFNSNLDDPKSFANTQTDLRFAEIAASFNFDKAGKLTRDTIGAVQQRGDVLETVNYYQRQMLEEQQGEDNPGVRLALYFERKAPTLKNAYDILGDTALLTVFRTTFSLPSEMSQMAVEKQKALVDKRLNLKDLQDPVKLKKFIQRFTAMYDIENGNTQNSTLALMSGSSGTLSADTLFAISQLKR